MVSVVMVTNRPGAAEYLRTQLEKQTFRDFEVVVADDSGDATIKAWKHFKPRPRKPGDVWNLNKAYNDALNLVDGDLVVFVQDFIWLPANGLERFLEIHRLYPDSLVAGVGHKAKTGIDGISEVDERALQEPGVYPGNESHFELNWAACPSNLLVRFDEDMDSHYGGENQVFALKTGAPVVIDASNRCIGLNQDLWGRPAGWEEKHANKGYLQSKLSTLS